MVDQAMTTERSATTDERTHPGARFVAAARSAPHDGLLLLAALTANRSVLSAWLRREQRDPPIDIGGDGRDR